MTYEPPAIVEITYSYLESKKDYLCERFDLPRYNPTELLKMWRHFLKTKVFYRAVTIELFYKWLDSIRETLRKTIE